MWAGLAKQLSSSSASVAAPFTVAPLCRSDLLQKRIGILLILPVSIHGTSGLVAMTSASRAEGREFDLDLVSMLFADVFLATGSGFLSPPFAHSTIR